MDRVGLGPGLPARRRKKTGMVRFQTLSEGRWQVKRNSLTVREGITPKNRSGWSGLRACLAVFPVKSIPALPVRLARQSDGSGLPSATCRPGGRSGHGFHDERGRQAPDRVCVTRARCISVIEPAPGSAAVT